MLGVEFLSWKNKICLDIFSPIMKKKAQVRSLEN